MDKFIFHDRLYISNYGEFVIDNEADLRRHLNLVRKRGRTSCELIAPNGDYLSISIGRKDGSVQYTDIEQKLPYLVTKRNAPPEKDYIVYEVGLTPTPIKGEWVLPVKEVIEVVVYYFLHLKLPEWVEWEEV